MKGLQKTFVYVSILALTLTSSWSPVYAHGSGGYPPGPPLRMSFTLEEVGPGTGSADFRNFETPHVHPLDISPNGTRLAACNTPDGRVELYNINQTTGSLSHRASISVGVDPVSARFLDDSTLWVVNQISDSISIIDIANNRVTDTIITYRLIDSEPDGDLEGSPNGDEPADVVFINSGAQAVVSCSRTDILQLWNTSTLALEHEGLRLDGEEPRALATDGSNVYAAIFESGNGTTSISGAETTSTGFPPRTAVESALNPYGGAPVNGQFFNNAGAMDNGTGWVTDGTTVLPGDLGGAPPQVSLIVRNDGAGGWLDDNGKDWADLVDGANAALSGRITGWTLLDNDIARISESGSALSIDTGFDTDGYVERQMNINMAIGINPNDSSIVTVGTDATNEIRFEPNITGTFIQVMVSIVNGTTGAQIALTDLNEEHLAAVQGGTAYSTSSVVQGERNKSIGDPRGVAFTSDGSVAYITGMGSNNVVGINATGGSVGDRIATGHSIEVPDGPTGIKHHGTLDRMYVLSKFASCLTVIDTTTPGSETISQTVDIFDPTPSAIIDGRVHFYGTHETSGLGQIACASCHVDGRMDRLAWDLGNPLAFNAELGLQGFEKPVHGFGDGLLLDPEIANPAGVHNTSVLFSSEASFDDIHSMKGPMTTQTLQDIVGKEPFHWRGDRDGLEEFAGAFSGLQGDDAPLGSVEMAEFEAFLSTLWFSPNPLKPLDNALPGGPPLSSVFVGDHPNLNMPGALSPGDDTGKIGLYSAHGTQLPPGDAFQGFFDYVDLTRDSVFSCAVCHTIPIGAGSTSFFESPGFTTFVDIPPGPNGEAHQAMVSLDGTGQNHVKIPQLRNQLDKEGMFLNFSGVPSRAGFGVLHDGVIDGTTRFLAEPAFDADTDQTLADIVAFTFCISGMDLPALMALTGAPTGAAVGSFPIPPAAFDQTEHSAVGAQTVLPTGFGAGEDLFANLFVDLADDDEIDLVVDVVSSNGDTVRFTHIDDNGGIGARFLSDRPNTGLFTHANLLSQLVTDEKLVYTALAETTGRRIGLDRDADGGLNGDEDRLNTDTGNPDDNGFVGASFPAIIPLSNQFGTVTAALSGMAGKNTPGKNALVHIKGGSYSETMTISQPVSLKPFVNPETGISSGTVTIGAP